MRWPWWQQARPIEPRRAVNIRAQELETAKEILAEVFHARPGEVEEMIQRRLEESGPEERELGLWPATFCVRLGVKDVSARWMKASRALKKEEQVYGQKVAEMAKKHSSEAFYALDDPLEAALFSVLVELLKELERRREE
jgi:hypothetical protein